MKKNGEPKILLDCDVVIHFLKGGKILELPTIFPDRFVMLNTVKDELLKRSSNFIAINIFLLAGSVPVIPIPEDPEIIKEYFALKKLMGNGESACLAVARFRKEYVASSNISEIADYCKIHGIVYYTTMDLLHEAEMKGIINAPDCDLFIGEVKKRGSRLPCNTLEEFRKMKGLKLLKKT
jgi:predicted nucleic acid-binding protein